MAAKYDYDVILMDLQMPVMNGYDSSKNIRENTTEYNKKVPIYALSSSASVGVKNRVFQYGMDGHISKPFNPTDLYQTLKSHCPTQVF